MCVCVCVSSVSSDQRQLSDTPISFDMMMKLSQREVYICSAFTIANLFQGNDFEGISKKKSKNKRMPKTGELMLPSAHTHLHTQHT